MPQSTDFENLAGRGVRPRVGGRQVLVGTPPPARASTASPSTAWPTTVDRLLGEGKTLMLVAVDGQAAGVIAAADIVRPNAAQAIAELKRAGHRAGDDDRRQPSAPPRRSRKQVGIERVFAEVLPEDKADGRQAAPGRGQVRRRWSATA